MIMLYICYDMIIQLCMYVCVCTYVCMYIYIYTHTWNAAAEDRRVQQGALRRLARRLQAELAVHHDVLVN